VLNIRLENQDGNMTERVLQKNRSELTLKYKYSHKFKSPVGSPSEKTRTKHKVKNIRLNIVLGRN
jgi:hypothetical protein